ncbi:hypothetical protein H1R81_16490 [Emticicia sp. BO119]|nr:hypothetical protein [Emticicia sp. BO119]
MTYKKLRILAWALLLITILSIRCHISITKNYYYSGTSQKLTQTETIIYVHDDKIDSEL